VRPQVGMFSDVFAALKLRSAPVTVVISLLVVWGWALTAFPMAALAGVPLFKTLLGKLVLFGLSGVVGLGLTGLCVRPLAPLFAAESGLKRDDLVGHIVEVNTGRVSDRFGQATVYSQGSDHVIQVRNDHEQNGLKKGSRALIVNYDDHRAAFLVEPLPMSRQARTSAAAPRGAPRPKAAPYEPSNRACFFTSSAQASSNFSPGANAPRRTG
jgi:hypothetical protein